MKTPREILLTHHEAAEPKLDSLRRDVLKNLSPTQNRHESRLKNLIGAYRDLFRVPRWAWGGLAAAWLAIVALNIAAKETPMSQPAQSIITKRSSDTLQALREQKQLFAELVGLRPQNGDAEAPRFVPRPRSERAEATACV